MWELCENVQFKCFKRLARTGILQAQQRYNRGIDDDSVLLWVPVMPKILNRSKFKIVHD
jgi:hypothetical protein